MDHCRTIVQPLIASAQEEVLMTTFLYDPSSDCAHAINDALIALNKNGRKIRVNMVICTVSELRFGLTGWNWKTLPSLRNVFAHGLSPASSSTFLLPNADQIPNINLTVKTFFTWPLGAIHSKLLIVDGWKFAAGSKNMDGNDGYEYLAELHGDVAMSARMDFQNVWEESLPSLSTPIPSISNPVPMLYLGRTPNSSMFQAPQGASQNVAWITAINHAKTSIYIQTPGFVTDATLSAIEQAVRRGVHVTVVTAFYWQNFFEKWYTHSVGDNRQSAHQLYSTLADDPAALARFKLCYFLGKRVDPPQPQKKEWSHVKFMAIDESYMIFG